MPSTSNNADIVSKGSNPEKPAIVMNGVSKSFKIKHTNSFKETFVAKIRGEKTSSDFNAVDDVFLEVPAGQSIAIMGRNGSGKSTTLKLISGVMRPDKGWIRTRGRIAGLLEVGAGFNPNLTGRDNVYLNAAILGMSKAETEARFNDILEFSEIGDFIDTEVKHYSSGMYSRLGFSVAVHTEFDILLVDEILSVGDAVFRKKCEDRMLELKAQGKTLFVVSHNAGQVKKLCERGVVLQDGKPAFDGPVNDAVNFLDPHRKAEPNYDVLGPIKEFYDQSSGKLGKPTGNQQQISENGGGLLQEFEKGIITHSYAAPLETATFGLGNSFLLTAYQRAGGPAGPWGFIAGKQYGTLKDGEMRALPFQNGLAGVTLDDGLIYRPHLSS